MPCRGARKKVPDPLSCTLNTYPSGTSGSTIPIVIHAGIWEGLATDGQPLHSNR